MRYLRLLVLLAALVSPATALGAPQHHRHCGRRHHHHPCVRHHRHRHHRTPQVSYRAKVDPSFTQAPANPLVVTYAYSGSAFSINGTTVTNLAQTGQLPGGVLNFYSQTTPGGPQQLYCSMNVGMTVVGGNCQITYPTTGTYQVTTQYIPNGVAAVTETDTEVILPYSTTTTLTTKALGCGSDDIPVQYQTSGVPAGFQEACYQLTVGLIDQEGNPPPFSEVTMTSGVPMDGNTLRNGSVCSLGVWVVPADPNDPNSTGASGGYSPDCYNSTVSLRWSTASPIQAWKLSASYSAFTGWADSTASVSLVP